MSTPSDSGMYERIKKDIFSKNTQNSAYRSGAVVKEYKKQFTAKYGSAKDPYEGKKKNVGLTRWFKEDWQNQDGGKGYKSNRIENSLFADIYRPTKKITSKTPKTFSELSTTEIKKAQNEKLKKGRVTKY
jgi:hypothetical protein